MTSRFAHRGACSGPLGRSWSTSAFLVAMFAPGCLHKHQVKTRFTGSSAPPVSGWQLCLIVVAFLSSAMILGVDGVCVDWQHSRCPGCYCCPVTCPAWSNTESKTGCTEYQQYARSPTLLASCSTAICESSCGSGCSRNCNNANGMLPSTPQSYSNTVTPIARQSRWAMSIVVASQTGSVRH